MSIIRVDKKKGGWSALPRSLFEDDKLSLDARGLAGWLGTRTDNFIISPSGIRKLLGIGKEKYGRIAGELQRGGYLERVEGRDNSGRFIWEFIFQLVPQSVFPPAAGFPPTVKPLAAYPPLTVDKTNNRFKNSRSSGGAAASTALNDQFERLARAGATSSKPDLDLDRLRLGEARLLAETLPIAAAIEALRRCRWPSQAEAALQAALNAQRRMEQEEATRLALDVPPLLIDEGMRAVGAEILKAGERRRADKKRSAPPPSR